MTAALLAVGVLLLGGTGAVARFVFDSLVERRNASEFPFGTFAINVSGSLVLGGLTGASLASSTLLLAGTALLGSFTTFSTWMLETERLAEDGEGRLALANLAVSLGGGLAAAGLGWAIGAAL